MILAPALIFVSMLIIQFALWLDATHAALAAAQEGDRAARAAEFNQSNWRQTATQVAMNYYHGLDTSVIADVSVSRISLRPGHEHRVGHGQRQAQRHLPADDQRDRQRPGGVLQVVEERGCDSSDAAA